MKQIYRVGAGGFAREVAWLIEDINNKELTWEILGFIDENPNLINQKLNGYKVLGGIDYLNNQNKTNVAIAIGNGMIREKLVNKIKNHKFITLIHPTVIKSNLITIGEGTIICAGSILTTNITLGKHVVVSIDSKISHDSKINNFVTILPSVIISGNISIGEKTLIGTGSAIIQGINIGKESIIGAGSVVIKDISNNCTVVGVPGRVIK